MRTACAAAAMVVVGSVAAVTMAQMAMAHLRCKSPRIRLHSMAVGNSTRLEILGEV